MKIQEKEEFKQVNMFGIGAPNTGFARHSTGNSYLNPLTKSGESSIFPTDMTFEPGYRSNWHIHHADEGGSQILVRTMGSGWYQEEGKDTVGLEPGTAIAIPAEVKHWHGAETNSWFGHIVVEVPGTSTGNEWCGPVADREYEKLP